MKTNLAAAACTLAISAIALLGVRLVADLWLLGIVYSLQLYIALAAGACAVAAILLGARRMGSVLLLAALMFAGHSLWLAYRLLPAARPLPSGATTLKVVSFNILGNNRENGERIARYLVEADADVAYIFESAPLRPFIQALSTRYPYRIGCGEIVDFCDVMLLSKRPLIEPRMLSLSDLRHKRFATAAIDVDGQRVRLGAAHLSKPYFDAYHTLELRALAQFMARSAGPWIVGGDFNSAAIAPDMQAFADHEGMTTAGREPATWPIWAGPLGIAIDHIFVSKSLVPQSLDRIADNFGSNHYGLVAEIGIAGN